jgi:hypothetical protein
VIVSEFPICMMNDEPDVEIFVAVQRSRTSVELVSEMMSLLDAQLVNVQFTNETETLSPMNTPRVHMLNSIPLNRITALWSLPIRFPAGPKRRKMAPEEYIEILSAHGKVVEMVDAG